MTTLSNTGGPASTRFPRGLAGTLGNHTPPDDRSGGSDTSARGNPATRSRGIQNNSGPSNMPRPQGRLRAALRLGTLNIRGIRSSRSRQSKLSDVVRMMRTEKWAVLALQETHETSEAANSLESFDQRVWCFPNPGTAHSAGTMFIVFKDFLTGVKGREEITNDIIIEGRAQVLTFKWRGEEDMKIVNVYAPNDQGEATTFFRELKAKVPRRPDFILGDFNHVENMMDKQPQRGPPPTGTREALAELRTTHGLIDGWRNANIGVHSFTWSASHVNENGSLSRSRIDRILASQEMTERAFLWEHRSSQELSDHDLATVAIFDDVAPEMGEGIWKMAIEDVSDSTGMDQARKCLLKCERRMMHEDPMKVWLDTKNRIRNIFKSRHERLKKERGRHLRALKEILKKEKNRPDFAQNRGAQEKSMDLECEIGEIEKAKRDKAAASSAARYQLKGEQVNKYWFSIGKSLTKDSTIRGLLDERGMLTTSTGKMGEIAARYHGKLQERPKMTEERERAIEKMVQLTDGKSISPEDASILAAEISADEAASAIKVSQGGKYPGEDGIIYEFYKEILSWEGRPPDENKAYPTISRILTRVWNAKSRGTKGVPREYTRGLMAPLYKKGDKRRVENYRPITLLNTDYKLETKCLATRCGKTLPSVIHEDQAGFVPGRNILDHVKLAKVVTEFCETNERDGSIVSLDQEKAYDKIDHDYLWAVLEAYGVPKGFVDRVKSLYANSETAVLINRTKSPWFWVRRGVRQGDPLSCLLFDLAIEPLAESFRRSSLRGIKAPGQASRLLCKLFADNTQLYLAKHDKWSDAMAITREWCLASGAKFNETKTEIVPVGSPRHRSTVVETRCLQGTLARRCGPDNPPEILPDGVRIARDGEAIRILGGWIGNKSDPEAIWETVISKIEMLADKWSKRRLTMQGRKLIVNFVLLSRAQYLLMVNDPSPRTVDRIMAAVKGVIWHGKARGIMTMDELYRPVEEGGLNLPNFRARQESAHLTWVKKWRSPPRYRPQWAGFLDALLRRTSSDAEDDRMTSMLEQTWREKQGPRSLLSKELRAMLATMVKHNVTVDAPKFAFEAKLQAPVWLSKTVDRTRREEQFAGAKALREIHGVQTQGDLHRISDVATDGCRKHKQCLTIKKFWLDATLPKVNPALTTPVKQRTGVRDGLDHTEQRLRRNREARANGEAVCLNPDVTHRGDLVLATRVFGEPHSIRRPPATRRTDAEPVGRTVEVYTDGSADKNGKDDSKCGAGVWSEDESIRESFRVAGYPPTNNRGEAAAALWALEKVPRNQPMKIFTDSTYVLNAFVDGYKRWEDIGWLDVVNSDILQRALYLVRSRVAETWIEKVEAHVGILGNEEADKAAKEGLKDPYPLLQKTEVPEEWSFSGARLSALGFSDLSRWTKKLMTGPKRTKAKEIVEGVRQALLQDTGDLHSEKSLWKSIRTAPIRREVTDFLWTAIHGRTVCGPFLAKWGGEWEERSKCECGALETLPHILVECPTRTWRIRAWKEAQSIINDADNAQGADWDLPSYNQILGIGLLDTGRKKRDRLVKIVVSETAFTIWKLRNAARIRDERITAARAKAAVRDAVARRAKVDFDTSRLPEHDPGRPPRDLVEGTWDGVAHHLPARLRWISSDYG